MPFKFGRLINTAGRRYTHAWAANLPLKKARKSKSHCTREPDFHIWNANSQSCARAKSEAKMATHGGKFCTSVSALFAHLYVSSSPLNDFNLHFLFGSTSKTFSTVEKVLRRNITGPVLHNRVFKRIHYCCVA